jgi:hypothetical protein
MAWTLVASTHFTSSNPGGTSSSINTTGADLIVIVESSFSFGTIVAPADSYSNSYGVAVQQLSVSGRQTGTIWFLHNPTVGTAHVFTAENFFGTLEVYAFSGSGTGVVLDQTNSASVAGDGSTTFTAQPGSVTPSTGGQLLIGGWALDNPADTGSPPFSVDSGFTLASYDDTVPGSLFGCVGAYLFQSTAAAVNPTMTRSNATASGDATAAMIATFKGAGGSTTTLTAAPGTFAETGPDAVITASNAIVLSTTPSFALNGLAVAYGFGEGETAGTYNVTLITPNVNFSEAAGVPVGSYSYIGISKDFARADAPPAATYTGTYNTQSFNFNISPPVATYALTGYAATLTVTTAGTMLVTSGSFAETGYAVGFNQTQPENVGTIGLTGISITYGNMLAPPVAAYTVTILSATVTAQNVEQQSVGSFNDNTPVATFAFVNAAALAAYTGTYNAAALMAIIPMPVSPSAFSLVMEPVALTVFVPPTASDAGSYRLLGEVSALIAAVKENVTPQAYSLSGNSASFNIATFKVGDYTLMIPSEDNVIKVYSEDRVITLAPKLAQ